MFRLLDQTALSKARTVAPPRGTDKSLLPRSHRRTDIPWFSPRLVDPSLTLANAKMHSQPPHSTSDDQQLPAKILLWSSRRRHIQQTSASPSPFTVAGHRIGRDPPCGELRLSLFHRDREDEVIAQMPSTEPPFLSFVLHSPSPSVLPSPSPSPY